MTDDQLEMLAELHIRQTASAAYYYLGAAGLGTHKCVDFADEIRQNGRRIWAEIKERELTKGETYPTC